MICPHCGKHIDQVRKKEYSGGKQQEKKFIEFSFKIKRETAKAIGVDWLGEETLWLPKSQCRHTTGEAIGEDDFDEGQVVSLNLTEWIAKEKGLIEENGEAKPKPKPKEEDDIPF
jgi:hypothetical protein